jgi:hypothetical protein
LSQRNEREEREEREERRGEERRKKRERGLLKSYTSGNPPCCQWSKPFGPTFPHPPALPWIR